MLISSDATDLSSLQWSRGDYDPTALTEVYTADDARVRIVLRELLDKVSDVTKMRALGFCVSVEHAEYMARAFQAAHKPRLVRCVHQRHQHLPHAPRGPGDDDSRLILHHILLQPPGIP